jgi:hypothetical protein
MNKKLILPIELSDGSLHALHCNLELGEEYCMDIDERLCNYIESEVEDS